MFSVSKQTEIDIDMDDNANDALNTTQMYSMELWIETIECIKGKPPAQEETSGKEDADEGELTAANRKLGYNAIKSSESESTLRSVKSKKSIEVGNDRRRSKRRQSKLKKKAKLRKKKYSAEKKSIYKLEESTGDYILPSGMKPFRVRFSLFNRNVTLTQLDYDKIFQIKQMLQQATAATSAGPEPSSKTENGGQEEQTSTKIASEKSTNDLERLSSTEKMESLEKKSSVEKKLTVKKSKSNISQGRLHKTLEERSEKSATAIDSSATTRNGSPERASAKIKTEDLTKLLKVFRKTHDFDYKLNVGELTDILEEDAFAPSSENIINKGCCVSVALTPTMAIHTLQCGSIQVTVDRFGGRKEDEGDPIGYATVKIPPDWQETVLHAATNPRITPVTLKVSNKVQIEDEPDKPVGRLAYTLILNCYAGCITSHSMPTYLGLCVSLAEGIKTGCHKPIVRENILLHSIKRKAIDENYEQILKARLYKMEE